MGGRGAGVGRGISGPAVGGKAGVVTYGGYGNKIEAAPSFTGNDGAITDFAIGAARVKSNDHLGSEGYDVYVNLSDRFTAKNMYFGEKKKNIDADMNGVAIGIKLATPQGVSEKQQNYAKSMFARYVKDSIDSASGTLGTTQTFSDLSNALKGMPKLNARQILDRLDRRGR